MGEIPLEYEKYTPIPGPITLGKRNFLSSQLPLTPAPGNATPTPLYRHAKDKD